MTTDSDLARDQPGADVLAALVEAERTSMQPRKGSKGQTWKRVVGTVAVDAPLPVEPTSIAGPTAASTAPWLKIVLGLVLGGVVAVGGYRLANDPEPVPTTRARTAGEPDEAPPPPASQPEAPSALAEPALPVVAPTEPTPASTDAPQTATPPASEPPKKPPPEPPASDLAEETRLLARARARLRAGSPDEALAPLGEHARRFPKGQLAEDRMVLRAQALCEAGKREDGRKAVAALRKAFPSSSHLPRVQRACE